MATPQPPRWPGDDRPIYDPEPGDSFRPPPPGYGQPGQASPPRIPPPPPGYGQPSYGDQAREQVRPQPQAQVQYGSYGQLPPPQLPVPYWAQGQPQPYYQIAPKNPALGVLASFFIPGLGSMINGNAGIGTLILCLWIVGVITTLVIVGWFLAPAMWIWGMIQGYQDAQKWNRQHGIIS